MLILQPDNLVFVWVPRRLLFTIIVSGKAMHIDQDLHTLRIFRACAESAKTSFAKVQSDRITNSVDCGRID